MFDVDGRSILMVVREDVYVLGVVLESLPAMAGCVREDEKLSGLYDALMARVHEMHSVVRDGREMEEIVVLGYSNQI